MNLAPIEQCTQCSQRVINLPSSKFITEYFKKKKKGTNGTNKTAKLETSIEDSNDKVIRISIFK